MAADAHIRSGWYLTEDKTLQFSVTDTAGNAVNITGWALDWTLYDSAGSAEVNKTDGSGITITDGPNGVLEVQVDAADTSSSAAGAYTQVLKRTDVGSVEVLAVGQVTIKAEY